MNILIVEDDARISGFLERGLRAEGHRTQLATTGPEAGIRAISAAGVVMSIPMVRIALGQNGTPKGAPEASNLRISRSRVTLAVSHSMARMVPALKGLVKVPA